MLLKIAFDYPFCSHFIHSDTAIVGLVIWEVPFHVAGTERCHGFPLFYRILWKFCIWFTWKNSQLDGLPSIKSRTVFDHAEMGFFFSVQNHCFMKIGESISSANQSTGLNINGFSLKCIFEQTWRKMIKKNTFKFNRIRPKK